MFETPSSLTWSARRSGHPNRYGKSSSHRTQSVLDPSALGCVRFFFHGTVIAQEGDPSATDVNGSRSRPAAVPLGSA